MVNLIIAFWGAAEVMQMARPAYRINTENPGSDLAAETAAALASMYLVLKRAGGDYAVYAEQKELLRHAKELFDFANQYRGKYSDSIRDAAQFYRSWSGYEDELVWAALWLYKATGEAHYLTYAENNYNNLLDEDHNGIQGRTAWTHAWDDKSYGSYVLLATLTGKEQYQHHAENWLNRWACTQTTDCVRRTSGGLVWLDQWGSLRYSANTALIAFIYADYLAKNNIKEDLVTSYQRFAKRQINYMLGDNSRQSSYVVGFGNNPPKNPHHRTAHGTWLGGSPLSIPNPSRHTLYGALVGGPGSTDDMDYIDNRNDYIRNEVALDYNAGFSGALARMVMEFGGRPLDNFPENAVRDDEFALEAKVNAQGVNFIEISALLRNKTAWPARITDNLSFRYFINLKEEINAGLTPENIAITTAFNQGAQVSALQVFDKEKAIYFIEIDFSGEAIAPGTQESHRREVQFRLSIPAELGISMNYQNDWSFREVIDGELTQDGRHLTHYIPVYEGNIRVFGLAPDSAPVNQAPIIDEDKSITIDQPSVPTALAISAPIDPEGGEVEVVITKVPVGASVIANSTGQVVHSGQKIAVNELTQLTVSYLGSNLTNDEFSYQAVDSAGNISTQRIRLLVENEAPIFGPNKTIAIYNQQYDQEIALNLPQPTDSNHDALTITVSRLPEHGQLTALGMVIRQGQTLSIAELSALNISYPIGTPINLVETLELIAQDARGGSAILTVQLTTKEQDLQQCTVKTELNEWENGFVAKLTVYNNSNLVVNDWQLDFKTKNYQVSNIWNADIATQGGVSSVSGKPYNQAIQVNNFISFGFQGVGHFQVPQAYLLNGQPCQQIGLSYKNRAPLMGENKIIQAAINDIVPLHLTLPEDPEGGVLDLNLVSVSEGVTVFAAGKKVFSGQSLTLSEFSQLAVQFPANTLANSSANLSLSAKDKQGARTVQTIRLIAKASDDFLVNCEVDFKIKDQWQNGFVADITIKNIGSELINGWQLTWDYNSQLINIWNARGEMKAGRVTLKNELYNSQIPAQGTVSFGFQGQGAAEVPEGILLNEEPCRIQSSNS
ncbi:glycoside hydrolase family 9 protein [Piscirickettsia litoralis]|uniref:Endoglucanase n=1 Tax=Piscirickettsia litoralis TaxID=1891921 RepID=A0ABX2ZYM9_9GAMM|nr:glycoside hydrolase family 9 protein [Piscirickettsia litoralis]ODN41731.1 hypothetical protein BGC07_00445 [Piscirickettsia litoralis]